MLNVVVCVFGQAVEGPQDECCLYAESDMEFERNAVQDLKQCP